LRIVRIIEKKNKVMKTKEAPEKIYLTQLMLFATPTIRSSDNEVEYTRTDAFIETAKKWFEQQPETYDANDVRCYSMEDFENFVNYMKGE
jgi:hypothetical protein